MPIFLKYEIFCLNSNYSASSDEKFTKIVCNKRNTSDQLVQYEKFITLARDRTQPATLSWIVARVQQISRVALVGIKHS